MAPAFSQNQDPKQRMNKGDPDGTGAAFGRLVSSRLRNVEVVSCEYLADPQEPQALRDGDRIRIEDALQFLYAKRDPGKMPTQLELGYSGCNEARALWCNYSALISGRGTASFLQESFGRDAD